MKKWILLCMMTVMMIMTSCSQEDDVLTIGFSGTLTGSYATVGQIELYAIEMALEEINEAGGINGRQIELVIKDDEADPDKAVEVDNELIDMGIDIIIGHSISIVAEEAIANIDGKDVLMLSPSIGTEAVTDMDDLFIRNVPATLYEGREITSSIVADNPSKVLFFYSLDNYSLTSYHVTAFEETMAANGYTTDDYQTVGYHSQNASDYETMEQLLATEEYDALMFVGSNNDAAPIVNYIKANNIDIAVHLSSWAGINLLGLIETEETSGINAYFSFIEPLEDPDYLAYKTAFESTYEENAQMLSVNAYDIMYLLKTAIEHADSFDPHDIKAAIIEIGTFDGIAGEYTINAFGDCTKPLYRMIIQDGEYVLYSE